MRVLSIGNFYNPSWDSSIPDEEHIAKALEELGHEVTRAQREEVLLANGSNNFDFSLVAQWDGYGDLSWLPRPLVYWAFDYQADDQEWHERLVREADLYLSKRIADSKYPNWQWLSQDFSPNFLEPSFGWDKILEIKKDIDVLFTGSYLDWATERNDTLRAVNEKFNLVIHSVNSWPEEWHLDVRPPVMDEGLPDLYQRAKVILSIDHTIEAGYWSDRNAQIMCCGQKPLFRYIPLSEVTFKDSVEYFYDVEDCLNKIQARIDGVWNQADVLSYTYANSNLRVNNRVQDLLTIVENIL